MEELHKLLFDKIRQGDLKEVENLLLNNVNPNIKLKTTPLIFSACYGDFDGLYYAEIANYKYLFQYFDSDTSCKLIKLLIRYKGDVNLSHDISIIEKPKNYLYKMKPYSPLSSYNFISPLMAAVLSNNVKAVKLLLNLGANYDEFYGLKNYTPLMLAVEKNYIEIILLLLAKGADPCKKNPSKISALDLINVRAVEVLMSEFVLDKKLI